MKKKLVALALVLALAVSALSLVACGSDFSNTYKNMYSNKDLEQFFADQNVLNAQKDINLDFYGELNDEKGSNLGVFVKEGDNEKMTYKVYNFENDSVVATFTDTETVKYYLDADFIDSLFIDMNYYDYFYVEKSTTDATTQTVKTEYFVYDANGNAIGSADEAPNAVFDTLFIGNDYYRIKKDKFEKAGSRAKNAVQLPEFDNLLDGKYYVFNDEGDEYFAVYDKDFVLINYYKLPSYADLVAWGVLNDGNVLIQLAYEVPAQDSDYTIYLQQTKYKVVTLIYNLKKAETKEIDTTFMLRNYNMDSYIIAVDSFEGLTAKYSYGGDIKNIARVNFITDKQVDEDSKTVVLKNNGEVDQILFENFVGQDGAVRPLFSGKFVVYTEDGSKLLSEKGDIIADITGARYINNKYIVLDGKIYDHDFKELATFDEEKFRVQTMNNTVVLNSIENNKQYKLFVNGAFKEITLAEDETIVAGTERYYVIRKVTADATTYTYYNENGEALLTTALNLEEIGMTINGKIVLEGFDSANNKIVNIVLYTNNK